MVCNKRQLADVFGVSEETLTRWAGLGCPVQTKRRGSHGNEYDTAAVFTWRLALAENSREPADLENERVKLVRVQREIAEITLAERRRESVSVAGVMTHWAKMTSAARARCLLIPTMAAPLVIRKSAAEAEDVIRKLIYEALSELADGGGPK